MAFDLIATQQIKLSVDFSGYWQRHNGLKTGVAALLLIAKKRRESPKFQCSIRISYKAVGSIDDLVGSKMFGVDRDDVVSEMVMFGLEQLFTSGLLVNRRWL